MPVPVPVPAPAVAWGAIADCAGNGKVMVVVGSMRANKGKRGSIQSDGCVADGSLLWVWVEKDAAL